MIFNPPKRDSNHCFIMTAAYELAGFPYINEEYSAGLTPSVF